MDRGEAARSRRLRRRVQGGVVAEGAVSHPDVASSTPSSVTSPLQVAGMGNIFAMKCEDVNAQIQVTVLSGRYCIDR